MNTKDLAEQIENLENSSKMAILAIIDMKIDSEMSRYLEELRSIKETLVFKTNVILWVLGILFTIILAIAGFTIFK